MITKGEISIVLIDVLAIMVMVIITVLWFFIYGDMHVSFDSVYESEIDSSIREIRLYFRERKRNTHASVT